MQSTISIVCALALGALISVYMPMNSSVSKYLGSTLAANVIFFAVGLITTIIFYAMLEPIGTILGVVRIPPYLILSGFLSAILVFGMTYLIPVMGVRRLFILIVAGQILLALFVSHYKLFGSPSDPITFRKTVGALLLVLGVAISMSDN
jgi:transporter family-2 protein